jgi:hypothetical protein
MHVGRVIAQAVSRRVLTAEARLGTQVRLCGICGGQSGAEAGFRRVLRFSFHHHLLSGAGTDRPNSGRRTKWTQSHSTPRNLKKVPYMHSNISVFWAPLGLTN